MVEAGDDAILPWARAKGLVVVSADADFGGLLAGSGARGPSVVLLRSADDLASDDQATLLAANLPTMTDDLARGAVVVLSRRRIRVRDLPITKP